MIPANQYPKSAIRIILSENATLYPLYIIVASLVMSGLFKHYSLNDDTGMFAGTKEFSTLLLLASITLIPIFTAISIYKVKKIHSFLKRGVQITGKVININREPSYQLKSIGPINVRCLFNEESIGSIDVGYLFNEESYLIKKKIRFIRKFKNIQIYDELQLVIDPNSPNELLILDIYL